MFVYHRLSNIVLRFGMRASVFACHTVILPPLLGPYATTLLLPLQSHLLRVNEFPVRERVETLPSPRGGLVRASSNNAGGVVASPRDVVHPFTTLQRLQRVFVAAVDRKQEDIRIKK